MPNLRRLPCLFFVLAIVPAFAQPASPNLLANSSFESLSANAPSGWHVEGPWQPRTGGASAGRVYMFLPGASSSAWNKLLWLGYVEVGHGETVTLSADYRSPTGKADIGLEFCDAFGGHIQWCDLAAAGPAATWTRLTRRFTIDDKLWALGVRSVRPYLQVTAAGAEVSYDNASLTTDRPVSGRPAHPISIDPLSAHDLAPPLPSGYKPFGAGPAVWDSAKHALKLTAGHGIAGFHSDPLPLDPTIGYDFTARVSTDGLSLAHLQAQIVVHGVDPKVVSSLVSTRPIRATCPPFDVHLRLLPRDLPPDAGSAEIRFVLTDEGAGKGTASIESVSLEPVAADLAVTSKALGNVFHVGKPVEFAVSVASYLKRQESGKLSWTVRDFHSEVAAKGSETGVRATLRPRLPGVGYYELDVAWIAAGKALARKHESFCVVNPWEKRFYSADSPFGSHPHGSESAMVLAKEAYIKWIRVNASWRWIEPERGQLHWQDLDAQVKRYEGLGMQILLTVMGTPEWASTYRKGMGLGAYWSSFEVYPPANDADYERFCELLARRYRGRIHVYEIWNEPNISFFLGTHAQFAEVLKAGYRGLKKGDPGCLVTFDAAGVDIPFFRDMFKFGAGNSFDILSVHNYQLGKRGPPERTPFYQGYLDMRKLLAIEGQPDKPIWDSEFCWMSQNFPGSPYWHGVGEANQARWLVRSYVFLLGAGGRRLFWFPFYPYYDPQTSGPHGGSLIHEDLTPKPAFVSCRVAAENLVGATWLRWIDLGPNVRCAIFRRGGERLAVVWAVEGTAHVALATRAHEVRECGMMGRSSELKPRKGIVALTATADATYLWTSADWRAASPPPESALAGALLCPPLSRAPVVDGNLSEWWEEAHPIGVNDEVRLGEGGKIINDPPLRDLRARIAAATFGGKLYLGVVVSGEKSKSAWLLAKGAISTAFVRDSAKGTTTFEAVLRAKPGPFELTVEAANGERLTYSGKLVFTWRPKPAAAEAVYPAETKLAQVRRITTVFPPGAAYRYEIWASGKTHPRDDLHSGDWRLLVAPKIAQGSVTDIVNTRARHFRTRITNLLTNSGFERPITAQPTPGLDRHPFPPNSWHPDRPYCTIDTSIAHTGSRSAKIVATGRTAADPWSNWGQIIRVKPKTTYTVSEWVKVGKLAPGAVVALALHGYPADSEEQLNNQDTPARADVAGWQHLTNTVTTRAGVARLVVWCDVKGDGTAWFDDVQVIEGDVATDVPEVVGQRFGG